MPAIEYYTACTLLFAVFVSVRCKARASFSCMSAMALAILKSAGHLQGIALALCTCAHAFQ
jgi:hypothetical protein